MVSNPPLRPDTAALSIFMGNTMALRRPHKGMKKAVASHGTGGRAGFKPAPTARYGGTVYFHGKHHGLAKAT